MFYITSAKMVPENYKQNKNGGVTVSVQKRGGWKSAWQTAKEIAGWKAD